MYRCETVILSVTHLASDGNGGRSMSLFLTLAFLFFIGSVSGWVLELFFRRFFSAANPERKWINPGFCTGPYLPLYGTGLCLLYLISSLEERNIIANPIWNKVVLFLVMAFCMTAIEYIAGFAALHFSKVRLWDYSGEWGNIQGIICPKFSFFWAVLGALYYFLIHPRILSALAWLSENLAFSFVIGLFFGVFAVDVVQSAQLVAKLKRYAEEYQVVVRFEELKAHIRSRYDEGKKKYHFFRPFRTERPLSEHIREWIETLESHKPKLKGSRKH